MTAAAPTLRRSATVRGLAPRLALGLATVTALLVPGTALAADTIVMTVATDLAPGPAFGATMSTAARPTYVGYTVSFVNDQNPSTLTQIVLTVDAPTATAGSVTGTGSYVDTFPNGDGACAATASGVRCTLDQLKPGDGFNRTFVFSTPAYDAALVGASLTFPAGSTVLSVKEGLNDGGSRQDTFTAGASRSTPLLDVIIGTGGNEDDFFSTYVLPTGGTFTTTSGNIETNTSQLGSVNKQATKVTIPSTPRGTEATLEEIASGLCPAGQTCFGQASKLTIPGLQSGDRVTVYLRWDASIIPSGITNRNLKVAWDASDVGTDWIVITTTCNSTASNAPCRYAATRFKDKDLGVKIVLPHNGVIKGL